MYTIITVKIHAQRKEFRKLCLPDWVPGNRRYILGICQIYNYTVRENKIETACTFFYIFSSPLYELYRVASELKTLLLLFKFIKIHTHLIRVILRLI